MEQSNGRGLPTFVVVTAAIALVQQLNAAVILWLPELLPLRLYPISREALAFHFAAGVPLIAFGLLVAARRTQAWGRVFDDGAAIIVWILLAVHAFGGALFLTDLKSTYAALPAIVTLMVSSALFCVPLLLTLFFGPDRVPLGNSPASIGRVGWYTIFSVLIYAIVVAVVTLAALLASAYHNALSKTVLSGQPFDWSQLQPSALWTWVASDSARDTVAPLVALVVIALLSLLVIAVIAVAYRDADRDLTPEEIEKLDGAVSEIDRFTSGPLPLWYRGLIWMRRAGVVAAIAGGLILSSYAVDVVLAYFQWTTDASATWYLYIPLSAEFSFLVGIAAALVVLSIDHLQTYFWPEFRELEFRRGWSWWHTRAQMLQRARMGLAASLRFNKEHLDSFDAREAMRRRYRAGEPALYAATLLLGLSAVPAVHNALGKYYLFTEGHFELPSAPSNNHPVFHARETISYSQVERVESGCAFDEGQSPSVWYAMILKDGRDFNILSASDIGSHLRYYEHIDENLTKLKVNFEPAVEEGCIEALTQEWSDAARQRVVRLLHVPATSL